MSHHAHDSADHHHGDHHDEKTTRLVVLASLALFFTMTCVGHYVFVASQHHTTAESAQGPEDGH